MNVKKVLKDCEEKFITYIKRIKKRTVYCIGIGIVLAIISFFINDESIYIRPNEIARGQYGNSKVPYSIKVDVENLTKNLDFDISVSSKKYTKEEADRLFKTKYEELIISMLGENIDYENINQKLVFANDVGDGVKATYSFEPHYKEENIIATDSTATKSNVDKYISTSSIATKSVATKSEVDQFKYFVKYQNLIDGYGNVKNEDFKADEVCSGYIELQFSTEIKEKEGAYRSSKYLIPIKVISKKLSSIDAFKHLFKKEVEKIDIETTDKDTLKLPNFLYDYKIVYKEEHNLTFLLMPIFGFLVAILLEARDKEKVKEEKKRRIRTLEIDFSQIISKMLLYVSSGMTIRNAMIRLADDYQGKLKKKSIEHRVAYDELIIVKNKLIGGYSEIRAYEEMAKNIGMRTYTRFLNIIIQSIKNGNKELKNILNMEAQDALYERKQKAKKMGEEAATKLILPLMMMLAVIITVIMVPAFMGM